MRIKNIIINLAVLSLSLLVLFLIGDVCLRFYHYYKFNINILNDANHGLMVKDEIKGWKMGSNLNYSCKEKDALGNVTTIHVKTDKNGFRIFGDNFSSKFKIFFIGDSFTASMNVSNESTFYGIIKNNLKDIEVFANGVGGYGSLQEYMILDEFIDLIKPNIIIWQFFWNDFLDNNSNLDIIKSFYNTGTPRPYLELNGQITHQYAKYDYFINLPVIFSKNFRLLKIMNVNFSKLFNKFSKDETSFDDELKISVKVTEMIMAMAKRRAGKIPIYLFCINKRQPYYDLIHNICNSIGVTFIDAIPQKLEQIEEEHPNISKAADKEHLNEIGNRIVAEGLIQYLKENKLIH